MRSKQMQKLLQYLALSSMLLLMAIMSGCSSDGSNGTSVGTISGVVTDTFGNKVAGATVTPSPLPQGSQAVSTDSSGNYTISLPNGNYSVAYAQSGYASQTKSVNVISAQTTTTNVTLTPNAAAAVNVANGKFVAGSATLTATTIPYDPALQNQTVSYVWKDQNGATVGNSASLTVAQPSSAAYKAALAKLITVRMSIEPVGSGGSEDNEAGIDVPDLTQLVNRVQVAGIPQKAFEDAALRTYTVTATIGGRPFTSSPTVSVATNTLPFVPNPGLCNVPIGQPVMLQGKNSGTWNWTIAAPVGSTVAALVDNTTQTPHFIPDAVGTYTVNETVSGKSLTIYAGKYVGMLVPALPSNDPVGALDASCSAAACHSPSINSKFTEWKQSGHSEVMVKGMNEAPPGGHYSLTSCAKCHSVGYAMYSSAIKAGGFKEIADATKFKFTQGAASFVGYDQVLRVSEVQCEACHGPNGSGGAHSIGVNPTANSARVSVSSDVCGQCHGEPKRHGRFQEWRESGHGDFETAIGEGFTTVATPAPATTNMAAGSVLLRGSCSSCHTGQGFLAWVKQLQAGNANRRLTLPNVQVPGLLGLLATAEVDPSNANTPTGNYLADPAYANAVTPDTVQPQTCVTCHIPHNAGKQPGFEGNIVTLRGDYQAGGTFDGFTPLLPAGFQANGVGRGALCITCHNSRNGANVVTEDGVVSLHEDNDAFFGTKVSTTATSYAAPHEAAQGDVLMGRNAYFFNSGVVGQRSRHSMLSDSCVTCHLQKAPADPSLGYAPPLDGAGTNHTFAIVNDPNTKADVQINKVCSACHGGFDGTGVQKSYDTAYNNLLIETGNALYRIKTGANPPAGTVAKLVPGRSPQLAVTIAGVTTTYNITRPSLNAAATAVSTPSWFINVTFGPTTYTGVVNNATTTTFAGTAPGGTFGSTNALLFDQTLAKVNWNAVLVSTDSSKGIHNPSFVFEVLRRTTEVVQAIK